MTKDPQELEKLIESILFVYGSPLKLKKLADFLGKKESSLKPALKRLEERLNTTSGLRLITNGPEVQLVSGAASAKFVEKIFKKEHREELTRAALEVLAIVAYQGPVSRAEIELVRGVNSSYMLRNLLIRGLVKKDTSAGKGKAPHYEITLAAMRKFGLSRQEDLPAFNQIKAEVERVKSSFNEIE